MDQIAQTTNQPLPNAASTAKNNIIGRPFKKGQSGNPKGRPKGSKDRVIKLFVDDLTHEWKARGIQALQELSGKDLVKTCIAILPKDVLMTIEGNESVQYVISAQPVLSSKDWEKQAQAAIQERQAIEHEDNQ